MPKCVLCGEKNKILRYRYKEGKICGTCYNKKILKAECSLCHQTRTINIRFNGYPICKICYKAFTPLWKCSMCGKKGPAAKRVEDKPICNTCYCKNKKDIFIKKFIEMPLMPDTVMFIARGINGQKKDFTRKIGLLTETQKAKKKLAKAFNIMEKIPSGMKIIRKFILESRSKKMQKLKDTYFEITE